MNMFPPKACKNCGELIKSFIYKKPNYCTKPQCQRAQVNQQLLAQKKRQDILNNKIEKAGDKLAGVTQHEKWKIKRIVSLPSNQNAESLVSLNQSRKDKFKEHLYQVVNASDTAVLNHPYSSAIYAVETSKEEDTLIAKACGTCKGYCCRFGKNHAFLDKASVESIMKSLKNEVGLDDLLALYTQYFPDEVIKEGCIFQNVKGCTLPTQLRSFTCNRYLCNGLKKMMVQLEVTPLSKGVTYLGSMHDDELASVSVINDQEIN